jgi:hypothetical protein
MDCYGGLPIKALSALSRHAPDRRTVLPASPGASHADGETAVLG